MFMSLQCPKEQRFLGCYCNVHTVCSHLQVPPEPDDDDLDDADLVNCQVVVPLFVPPHPGQHLVLVGSSSRLGK